MITRMHTIATDLPPVRVLSVGLEDESVITGELATLTVLVNEEPVAEITGEVVKREGADGNWYPAVKLRFVERKEGE